MFYLSFFVRMRSRLTVLLFFLWWVLGVREEVRIILGEKKEYIRVKLYKVVGCIFESIVDWESGIEILRRDVVVVLVGVRLG